MINDFGPHAKPILIHRMINHHLSKHKSRVANVQAHAEFKELIDRSFQVRAKKNPKKELQEKIRLKEIQRDNDHLFKKLSNIYKGKYKDPIHTQQKANLYFIKRHCDYPRHTNNSEIISPRYYSPDSMESLKNKKVLLPQIDTRNNSKQRENTNILDELYHPTGPTPKSDYKDERIYGRGRKYFSPKMQDNSLLEGSLRRSPNDSLVQLSNPTKHTVSHMIDSEDDDLIAPITREQKYSSMPTPIIFQRKVKFKNSIYYFKVQDYDDVLVVSMRDSDYGKEYQLTLTPQETFKVKAKHGNDYEKLVKYLKLEREKLILMDHYALSIRNSANLADLKDKNLKLLNNNTVDGVISPIREYLPTESPVHEVPGYTFEKEKRPNRHKF